MPLSRRTYPETSSHATRQKNIRPQSSQLAEPSCTDLGIKSGISVRELTSGTKKKEEKSAGGE